MQPRVLQTDVRGDGTPVVLVPGGLTGWLSWIPHVERLSASRRTIRVQPIANELGSAGELGDPSYTIETERESLRLTLDALGLRTADFAGWSGGARALLEFALAYPERVRTMTLVEPPAWWVLEALGERSDETAEVDTFMRRIEGRDVTEDDLAAFLRIAGFVADASEARSHPNWERWLPHRNALSWQFEALERSDRTLDELRALPTPALLVKGTDSAQWLGRLVDVLGSLLPAAEVLELAGDHACHIQSMDAFLAAFERHSAAPARSG